MEGVLEHHHFGLGDALVMAELARDLERSLVGFQTGVAEEHVLHAGDLDQLGSQHFLAGHVVVVGAVDHLAHLFLQGGDQLGVRVAQGVDGNAAQTVQVLLAVHVPHAAASAMRHRDRQAAVSVHDVGGCGGNRCRHAGLQKQKALRTRVQKAGSRAATAPPKKNIVEQPERRACEIPYLLQHNMAACPALHATPLTVAAWG